jgi:cell wall-associated NlpC family hydrolase
MSEQSVNTAKLAAGAAALPLVAMSAVLMVLGGGGASASPSSAACGGGGTAQTIDSVRLDAEQMGNARTIVSVVAGRHLPVYAADVAMTTAYTESKLHNSARQTDHDSEGLFQQRVAIYTEQVAIDPVRATNAFVDRLVKIRNWQTAPAGVDAQTVQASSHPERYQPNAALAESIVGQFWSASVAAAGSASAKAPAWGAEPTICAGGGGAATGGDVAGKIVGPTGNNIAGVTSIPAGFVISGSAKGVLAVRYALKQLGKPYAFGDAGPNSFDCSGLTMAAWASAGVALPHLASAQTASGTPEPTNLSQAVGGDLVMIPGSDGTPTAPGHVGIVAGYVDREDGRHVYLVQAPQSGLPIELTEATEWSGQITDVRHIG